MRKIKFRAWTGSIMESDVVVGNVGAFYHSGLDPEDAASLGQFNTIYSEQVPIMQYTGLKDKNGVEIYEGDIVNIHTINGIDKTTVSYHGIGFYFQDVDNEANIRPLDHYKREVIGNVYENPELLEK